MLKKNKTNITEVGIDVSSNGVLRANEKEIKAFVRPLEYYNNDKELFDYVVVSEVIEHVENSEYFVTRGYELAKQKLIITIPNTGYYTYRLRLLFGKFPVQWVHHPAEHLRFWTIKDFEMWLGSLNLEFKEIRVISSNGLPYFNIYKLLPSLFAKQCVFVLEK